MMTVHLESLKKIFDNVEGIENVHYIARDCYADLGGGKVMRAYFSSVDMGRNKNALSINIMSKDKGKIDAMVIRFDDIWSQRYNICGNKEGPHIGTYNGKDQWYTPEPSNEDYRKLSDMVSSYVDYFSELGMEQQEGMSGMGM